MRTAQAPTTTIRSIRLAVCPRLTLLLVAIAAVALSACAHNARGARTSQPGDVRLVYRVIKPQRGDVDHVAKLLAQRLTDAGVPANVTAAVAAGEDQIAVDASPDGGTRPALNALTAPGQVAIYDWEARVIGPSGTPAPADAKVTGGRDAGIAGSLTRYDAIKRAAARPHDQTTTKTYWLVDDERRRVLAGPASTRAQLPRRKRIGATRVITVNAASSIVQAQFPAADQWYVIDRSPALSAADIQAAKSATDRRSKKDGVVLVQFTARGQDAFARLTRTLAHRGRWASADQHFAIVIDDKIVAVPRIDAQMAPDGLDGAAGALIEGGLSPDDAARLAAVLDSGPLPAALHLTTGPLNP